MKKATRSIDWSLLSQRLQGPHVVGGTPRDVEQPHALPRDVEGEEAAVVVGDAVSGRSVDSHLDHAIAGSFQRELEFDGSNPIVELGHSAAELGGRRASPGFSHGHRQPHTVEALAPHLDSQPERLVRHTDPGGVDGAHTGVLGRALHDCHGVHRGAENGERIAQLRVTQRAGRPRESAIAHHHHGLRPFASGLPEVPGGVLEIARRRRAVVSGAGRESFGLGFAEPHPLQTRLRRTAFDGPEQPEPELAAGACLGRELEAT